MVNILNYTHFPWMNIYIYLYGLLSALDNWILGNHVSNIKDSSIFYHNDIIPILRVDPYIETAMCCCIIYLIVRLDKLMVLIWIYYIGSRYLVLYCVNVPGWIKWHDSPWERITWCKWDNFPRESITLIHMR